MIHSSKLTDQQFADFLQTHPVSGGCGTHGAEDAAAQQQSQFTNQMISEGTQVFGQDSSVFNQLVGAYSPIVKAGPSQRGFSAAEDNALKAQIVQSTAVGYRNAAAAAKSGVAGFGGGNTLTTSGVGLNANVGVAEHAAATQAGELNKETQANWATGRENWLNASKGLEGAGQVFSNVQGFNQSAQSGLQQNMANAQAQDAVSNWWAKDLTGAVMGGVSAFTGGMGGGLAKMALGGMGGVGNQAFTNPGLMAGPTASPQAPDIGSGGQDQFNPPTF